MPVLDAGDFLVVKMGEEGDDDEDEDDTVVMAELIMGSYGYERWPADVEGKETESFSRVVLFVPVELPGGGILVSGRACQVITYLSISL